MSKIISTTILAIFLAMSLWFWNSAVTPALSSLAERSCTELSIARPFALESTPYSRILRVKGSIPPYTPVSVGLTTLTRSDLLKQNKIFTYFNIPAFSHGPLNINADATGIKEACISSYLTHSKNKFIAVFSDYSRIIPKSSWATFSVFAIFLLFFRLSTYRGNPLVSVICLIPAVALALATNLTLIMYGIKLYVSIQFYILLLGLTISTATLWQFRSETKRALDYLLKPTQWSHPSKRESILWATGIVVAATLTYLPMFSHIFRHDEWFYFFTFRENTGGLLKYIDWQLFLPSDRLIFRPLHHSMLAANMLLFGPNYIWPHFLSFLKHLIATALVFAFLWKTHPHRLTFLITALFALLFTQMDPVAWAHVDAYIVSAALLLGASLIFFRSCDGLTTPAKGFGISALLLLAAMLTTELAFPAPLILFITYWSISRKTGHPLPGTDKYSLLLLLPFLGWALLFGLHLWQIYPDFTMSTQSSRLPLERSLYNSLVTILLSTYRILPLFTSTVSADKIYVSSSIYWYALCSCLLLAATIRWRRSLLFSGETLFYGAMTLAPWLTVSVARSSYIDSLLTDMLPALMTPTHYAYMANVFLVPALYSLIWRPMSSRPRISAAILVLLCLLNGIWVNSSLRRVSAELQPFRAEYDQLRRFVSEHVAEPDFSFKLVRRLMPSVPFNWYEASFPETFFWQYMNSSAPKYIAEFNRTTNELNRWKAADYPSQLQEGKWRIGLTGARPDFVNSSGMCFLRIPTPSGGFYSGMEEVTRGQWAAVMGIKSPSAPNEPAIGISWHDAMEFVKKLNAAEHTTAYRLPTEADRDKLAILTFNLQVANQRYGAVPVDGPTLCTWLAGSITTEKYTYPDTPRLCSGLIQHSGRRSEIYTAAYPPDYSFRDTGMRVVKDIR